MSRATLLAAFVAALGFTSLSPAFAAGPAAGPRQHPMMEFRQNAAGGPFALAALSCNPHAADRLEQRLDRIARRLALKPDQQKLFEEFRTAALTAQTDFADKCAELAPVVASKGQRPDPLQRLETRLKLDEARIATIEEMLPELRAFYESLDAHQQRELFPFGRAWPDGARHGLDG